MNPTTPGAPRSAVRQWGPPAAIVAGLALLTAYVFRVVIAGDGRLPGIDAPVHYTWEVYTRVALAAGQWPFWNPYLWAGTPHFADASTMVAYPPTALFRWVPALSSFGWLALTHIVIGGAGTLYLSRVVGLQWGSAAAAALAVTLGGAVGPWLHLGHIVVIYNVVWVPWALGLAMVTVARDKLIPHPALPFVLLIQFLAGHAQFFLYTVSAVTLYFLYSTAWPVPGRAARRWRPLAQLAVLGAITFGLAAFQFLPLFDFVRVSARGAGLSLDRAAAGGWAFRDVATMFWPAMGVVQEPVARVISQRVAYVGWLLTFLMPVAFTDARYRRAAVFFALLACCAAMLAFGARTPLFRLYYALVPGFRIPGRALFLVTLSFAVIGAIGLERYLALARDRRWRLVAGALAVTVAALAAASLIAWRNVLPAAPRPVHLWPWLPAIVLSAILAMGALGARRRTGLALAAGLLALAVDLTAYSSGAAATVSMESIDALEKWVGPAGAGRVWSTCPNRVDSNELLITRRPGIHGAVGLTFLQFTEWLDVVSSPDRPADAVGPFRIRRDLLDSANIGIVVSCEKLDAQGLTPLSYTRPVYVYRNERAWPRAIWTCGAEELPRAVVAAQLRLGRYDEVGVLTRRLPITVRWAPGVSDEQRQSLETQYRLRGSRHEGATFRYLLDDVSAAHLRALVRDPAVEDTGGVDRQSGAWIGADGSDAAGAGAELLVGTVPCSARGSARLVTADRPDGHVSADIDAPAGGGFVFFSEPYSKERRAFVDGEPAAARRANLAFTAVPVPAGRHRVELRLVPASFYMGAGITGATLVVWGAVVVTSSARLRNRSNQRKDSKR